LEKTALWKEKVQFLLDPQNKEFLALPPDVRQEMEEILDEAEAEGRLEELMDTVQGEIRGSGVHPVGHALMGLAALRLDWRDEAQALLTSLCGKLEQDGQWEALGWAADQLLQGTGSRKAPGFLVRAAKEGGRGILPAGALDRAYEIFPDHHEIAYLKAQEARERGDEAGARDFLRESLPGFVQAKDAERLEEIYLELTGEADEELLRTLFVSARRLAVRHWKIAEPLLELVLAQIETRELAQEVWDALLGLLVKVPAAGDAIRRMMRQMAPKAFPEVTDVDEILMRSGLFDEKTSAEAAAKNLRTLLGYAPGYYVLHATWGVGRIQSNDGENLIIDFASKPGHRMSLSLAQRALQILPRDDLRVLESARREELERMVRENPAQVVYLALREAGGQATASALRKRLAGSVVPEGSWAGWWKEAKAAMEQHPLLDLSLAYKNTYRIREGEEGDEMPLPTLDRRRGVRTNLNLIRRFLEQYPDALERSRRQHGPILKQWLAEEKTRPEDRLLLGLFLRRVFGNQEDLRGVVREALRRGMEPAEVGDEEDQALVVRTGLEDPEVEAEAILFGLASRHASVRQPVMERLVQDGAEAERIFGELLHEPARHPLALLTVAQEVLKADEDRKPWPDPWEVAASLVQLVDTTTRDTIRRQALALLDPEGPLAERLRQRPAPDTARGRWALVLSQWRSSERSLFKIYDFVQAVGLQEVVEEVQADRSEATNVALERGRVSLEIHGIPMTRATYRALMEERDRVARALRTEIPQAIRKARELGDLRENAEYDAAKLKQAQETERLARINRTLQNAQIIEEMVLPQDVVGPGTEVVLEDTATGRREKLWILGEGDDRHGDEVVSVLSDLGRALLGHKAGDVVRVEGQVPQEIRIVEMRRRLPDAAA
jgi:transcription elongation factor GreA